MATGVSASPIVLTCSLRVCTVAQVVTTGGRFLGKLMLYQLSYHRRKQDACYWRVRLR